MWLYFLLLWLAFGFAYWADYQRFYGWPKRWRARSNREDGWRDVCFVALPMGLIGGPLWWVAFVAMKLWYAGRP